MVAAASSKLCRSGRPYRKLLTDDDDDVAAAIVFLFLCFVSLVSLMLFRPFFPALLHVCCVRLANVFLPGQLSSRSRVSRTFLLLRALFSSESLRVPEMRIQLHVSQELFLLSPPSFAFFLLWSLYSFKPSPFDALLAHSLHIISSLSCPIVCRFSSVPPLSTFVRNPPGTVAVLDTKSH